MLGATITGAIGGIVGGVRGCDEGLREAGTVRDTPDIFANLIDLPLSFLIGLGVGAVQGAAFGFVLGVIVRWLVRRRELSAKTGPES